MTAPAQRPPALRRQYVKLCDRPDFDDPTIRERIRSIAPGRDPEDELHRKLWEYATLTLFLEDVGLLDEDARILAVGAGHEEVLYWLANRVGRVVATDIYGAGSFATREAEASMLTEPEAFAPYPYRQDHLDVLRMDARSLEFRDGEFDAVFSLSSIEHFGGPRDIAAAAQEIGRVVKPAGFAFIVTECLVESHLLDSPLVQTAIRIATLGRRCRGATPRKRAIDVFTPSELQRWIVEPSGLELVQPLDLSLSPESWKNLATWVGPEELVTASGRWSPHILLRARGGAWTSVALALAKRE